MKNKLAIFDMDGTLFDTREANFKAYQEALSIYDCHLDYDYFNNFCFGKHYKDFLPNLVSSDVEEVHNNKKVYYHKYLNYIKENKTLFSIMKLIKDEYYIALVTTASKDNTEEILDYFNKKDLFDLILTHNDIEKFKPDPEGFNKAISNFNIVPENTIIFEDSETGVEAARKTGASVIIVDKF